MKPDEFLKGGDFTVENQNSFLGGQNFETQQEKISRLQGEAQTAQNEANVSPLKRFGSELKSNVASIFLDPAAKFVGSAVRSPIDITRSLSGQQPLQDSFKLPSGKTTQSIQSQYSAPSTSNLDLASKLTGAVGETAGGAADILGYGQIAQNIPRLFKSFSNIKTPAIFEKQADKKLVSFAQDLTSRPINSKMAEDAIQKGSAGYTKPGFLSKGKIIPSAQDNKVAESVIPYIKRGASDQQNIDTINQGVKQINLGVREMVANNKSPFNLSQLKSKLVKAKNENNLLFAGDTSAEKAYDAVINEFVNFTNKGKKDTLGLLDSRQAFDQYITNKFPNAFKKDVTGQFIDPKDNIRANALLDVRRAVNTYISDLLPKNNPYRKALKNESYMIDALGRISSKLSTDPKTAGIIGKNQLQLLTEQYPILKWIVGGLVGAAGVSVGSSIINSTD